VGHEVYLVIKNFFLSTYIDPLVNSTFIALVTKKQNPCKVLDYHHISFERALLDLGAGVNLLPYTVYEMLSLGELQPTSITLQLVDRSIKRPRGILEDVLVKVGEFILPANFIVLDMEESPMPLPLPIILGRPFMRIADTKICVKKGIVSIKVNGEKIEFKIFDALKLPQYDMECFNVCMIQDVVEKVFQVHHIDPLEATFTQSFTRQTLSRNLKMLLMTSLKLCTFLSPPQSTQVGTPFHLKLLCLLILLFSLLLSRHQIWS
jgi:hypothetical protein